MGAAGCGGDGDGDDGGGHGDDGDGGVGVIVVGVSVVVVGMVIVWEGLWRGGSPVLDDYDIAVNTPLISIDRGLFWR